MDESQHRLRFGPRLVILGVWIVIAAQLWPGVPIAGAVAICGWGTALCAGRTANLAVTLVMYTPLAVFAVAAQLHAAIGSSSPAWRFAAALDAAAGVILTTLLVRYVAGRLIPTSR